jgi:cysteinyl-tRNA synthetase
MDLTLYNTLTKKKEKFIPLEKGKVKLYSCGPTVYDYAHIGNMWSYLTADILRRYLEYLGYEVRQIKNITDVGHFSEDDSLEVDGEDKMEKAAKRENKDPLDLANHYLNFYLADEKRLNILKPNFQPRPTQEIETIIQIIETLIKKGYAYETQDGVYFSVEKFKNYGQLSGNSLEEIKAGARVEVNEDKKNPADFALWIKRVGKNKKHILHWESPWGLGFPGWHIECTAMATKYLGDTLDIHTGGEDNIFPHHDCEIAQSEAFSGEKFVNFWIHTRHFYFESQKMSKSLQNVYTISPVPDNRYPNLEDSGYPALVFRTLKINSHYRSKANFTFKAMDQAQKNWTKINKFYLELKTLLEKKEPAPQKNQSPNHLDIQKYKQEFEKAMNDDLNTPLAFAVILELVKDFNRNKDLQTLNLMEIKKFIEKADQVFAILDEDHFQKPTTKEIPKSIIKLAEQRKKFRKQKNFQKSDQLRNEIKKQGYEVVDQGEGYDLIEG